MRVEQVKQAIEETPKGSNIIVEWTRDCKTLKSSEDEITKSVRMVGRMGIEYDKIKGVRVGRQLGELPETNQGLPSWQKFEIYPYLLKYVDKNKTDEENEEDEEKIYYLRLYKGTSNSTKHKTEWFKNGNPVSFDEIEGALLASEKKSSHGECFQVKIESITRLHREITFDRIEAEREEVAEGVAEPA